MSIKPNIQKHKRFIPALPNTLQHYMDRAQGEKGN